MRGSAIKQNRWGWEGHGEPSKAGPPAAGDAGTPGGLRMSSEKDSTLPGQPAQRSATRHGKKLCQCFILRPLLLVLSLGIPEESGLTPLGDTYVL